jgi:type I restriction enzyme S subunit
VKLAACQRFDPSQTPAGWTTEPIKNRLRLEYGTGLTDLERTPGSYPVYGSNGRIGTHRDYLIEGPGILVGRKGSVGEVHFSNAGFWPIDTVYYVRRLGDDDWRFLFYLLDYLSLGQLNAATGVPGLTRRDAHYMLGSFPPLPEQREVAATLGLADEAIQLARAKVETARQLKSALMQKLFVRGVPGRHRRFKSTKIGEFPESWQVRSVMSVLQEKPFNGISPRSRPEPPGTAILNVECVDEGACTQMHVSYVDVEDKDRKLYRAKKGDFYVLRGNGNREYVASGGLLLEEPDAETIFSDKLIRLRFKSSEVVERFVPYMWQSCSFLRRLQSKAECGSGLWMIGKRDIRRELFACPGKDEQGEIVAALDSVLEQIRACEREQESLAHLKQSLLQRLLSGRVRLTLAEVA